MEKKLVDLNEWEQFGAGANGYAYINKANPGLVLKLNREEMPAERAELDFRSAQEVYNMGIPCPAVYEMATDGKRVGYIGQMIRNKKSFARIISEDPSQLEPLAHQFAEYSRQFHSTPCNTEYFSDFGEYCRKMIYSSDKIPQDVKKKLGGYIDEMDKATTCIHGDFQIGNIIRAEDKDYWIDLGDFSYGDPDWDMCNMLSIAYFTPAKLVKSLFHIEKKQFKRFVDVYGADYYGERWKTKELNEKLDKVLSVKMGESIAKRPSSASLFLPYISGKKWLSKIIAVIADFVVTEKMYDDQYK